MLIFMTLLTFHLDVLVELCRFGVSECDSQLRFKQFWNMRRLWRMIMIVDHIELSSKSTSWINLDKLFSICLVGTSYKSEVHFYKLICDGMRGVVLFSLALKATCLLARKNKTDINRNHFFQTEAQENVLLGSTGLNEVDVNSGILKMMELMILFLMKFYEDAISNADVGNIQTKKRSVITFLLGDCNDEEVARKVAAEWEEEEERKRLAGLERLQDGIRVYDDGEFFFWCRGAKNRKREFSERTKAKFVWWRTIAASRRFRAVAQVALKKKQTSTIPQLRNQMMKQDLHHLHRLVIDYYEHIPPTGLGLILLGDLTTMMETTEESDDELWGNQNEWEIIRWRLYEVHGCCIYTGNWRIGYGTYVENKAKGGIGKERRNDSSI
ncbi:hypothetical protein Tco_0830079, partial [Tanacetum coccineum]